MTHEEAAEFAGEFRDGILDGRSSDGMCFAVCWPLQTILEAYGYPTRLVEADGPVHHFWLQAEDGTVIDPTADQFSTLEKPLPKVYVGRETVLSLIGVTPMKTRRHHNNTAQRKIRRGKTRDDAVRIAKRLGVPVANGRKVRP